MDPFQPGDVVHLCYTAVRTKQQQRRGALKPLISVSLSGVGWQPFIDLQLPALCGGFCHTVGIKANKEWIQRVDM